MKYIGKIDKEKLGKYKDRIITDDVVLTDERKQHIYNDHFKDFQKIIENIDKVVLEPNEILEDLKNEDTIFMINKIDKNSLNVVVKLNITGDKEHPQNSVMTAWIIREKNLKKMRACNKIIYKKE